MVTPCTLSGFLAIVERQDLACPWFTVSATEDLLAQ